MPIVLYLIGCCAIEGEPASVGKAMMKLAGLDVGPPRLPALPLSAEGMKNLEKDLRDIGFFDWA